MRLRWSRSERELDGELAHHLHHLAAEYERRGYSPREARLLARRDFGGGELVKEQCRDERRGFWRFNGLWQDIVFGARMMRRTPMITVAAILSLALGIGANTALVSLMDVVLWRDLAVPNPKQLTLVYWQGQGLPHELADGGAGSMWDEGGANVADFFSYGSFEALRRGVANNASVAAYSFPDPVSVSFAGKPTVALQRPVSGNFFSTLGVRAELGQVFSDRDDSHAAPATAVLTHRFWVRALSSDPAVIGKTIIIDNKPQIVLGVLDKGFGGLVPGDGTEIYATLHHSAREETAAGQLKLSNDRTWGTSILARRSPGVGNPQLQSVMNAIFQASWPKQLKNRATAPRIHLEDGQRGLGFLRQEFRNPLFVLGGLVGLLLLIACANIVNLLLARAVAREREVATRVALGCSRERLMRQFVTESALLALSGGVVSVGVGLATANILGQYLAQRDGRPIAVDFDWRILAVAASISVIALLLFGVFPAFRGTRLSRTAWGRPGAGGLGSAHRPKWNTGRMLIVGQMALSVMLVMIAVVFTRNLLALQASDPGFERRNLVMFGIRPGTSGYDKARLPSFYFNLEGRLAATPGVKAAGMAWMRPMNVGGWWETVRLAGQKAAAGNASVNGVTPQYLPLYVSHMVAGRNLSQADIDSDAKVAVISEDLARKLGQRNVVGQLIEFVDGPPGTQAPRYQVVGIAPVIVATSMKDRPFAVWVPMAKDSPEVTVVLRTGRSPSLVLPAIEQAMKEVDRNLPLVDVTTMEEQIAKGLQRERMFATLCGSFGMLALVLSVVGLYGVVSYSTFRRRGEIGVRLALGALPRQVFSMVLREGLLLTLLGIAGAAPVVWFGARLIEKSLSGTKPFEPGALLVTLLILGIAATAAVLIPALRASSLQPGETLRQE